jgi:hypothetical protein
MAEVQGTAKSNDENIPPSRKSLTIEDRNINEAALCVLPPDREEGSTEGIEVSVRLGNKPVGQSLTKDIS